MNKNNLDELKALSPLTYSLERIFWLAQFAFVGTYYFKTRVWVDEQVEKGGNRLALTRARAHKIELYLVVWTIILVAVACIVPNLEPICGKSFTLISAYRILELVQSAININIFDRLRMFKTTNYVASKERILIISIWNFIEIWFCFGIMYSANLQFLTNASQITDAYYFSAVTQLTIGYGDLSPTQLLRFLAPLQGFIAFLLAIVVLSRFVSLLPAMEAVHPDDNNPLPKN